jgi:hypothetical protein
MKKLVGIFLVALVVGCGTRKTEQGENLEKIKSDSFTSSSDFFTLKQFELNQSLDLGYTYTKEPTPYGIKETFIQNNKREEKRKTIDLKRYKTIYTRVTIATKIIIKTKKTQSDGVSYWVWFTGLFFAFLFAVVWNWKRIITMYKRN